MAKYIKHYYVDELTGQYLLDTNHTGNGKTHPDLAGLDVIFWFVDNNGIDYCISTVPDSTTVPSVSGIQELTYQNLVAEVSAQFDSRKSQIIANSVYLQELGKTAEEVAAFVIDTTDINTLKNSFHQFAASKPLIQVN